jgi:hypothetical protein
MINKKGEIMQIQKRQKLLLAVTILLVIITFLSTFVITGCGRRAKVIAAKEKAGQAEEQNGQSQTEAVKESGNSGAEETVKETTEAGESTKEEESVSPEESGENKDNSAETEESIENDETTASESAQETTEDEETIASESAEETTVEERTEYTADMPYVRAECANIFGGEFLYDYTGIIPGDTGEDNPEVRGFMSYDISQLLGAAIESAKISGTAESLLGTPVATYGPMIIKSVYWGARTISPSEFDLNGTEITSISKTNFTKSPEALKDTLQSAVNRGLKRYQLCFYFEMSQTDGDGEADYIYYPFPDIVLTVTYSK